LIDLNGWQGLIDITLAVSRLTHRTVLKQTLQGVGDSLGARGIRSRNTEHPRDHNPQPQLSM
jgi:hypothetical protein